MEAFLNDEKVKTKYLDRVQAHAKADQIIKGIYWQGGKGCAVGCTIEGSEHARYETELGIPRAIARLEDRIFEGLPNGEAKEFPLKFLNAVNVGADLSMVMPKFFVWLLGDKEDGVIKFAKGYKKTEKAIKDVLKLYQDTVGGKVVKQSAWIKVRAAAADAYADAAYADAYADAAADAYAADAAADAYAAADAAAYAYAYAYADAYADAAADAYADAAARKTARENHYSKMAKKLLELLSEAK